MASIPSPDSLSAASRTRFDTDYAELTALLQELDGRTRRFSSNVARLHQQLPAQTRLTAVYEAYSRSNQASVTETVEHGAEQQQQDQVDGPVSGEEVKGAVESVVLL